MKKIFFVFVALALLAAGCNKSQTLSGVSSGNQLFTGIATSAFEDYNAKTTYTLQYNPANFAIATPAGHDNTVNIKPLAKGDSGKISTIQILNNEGAGFSGSDDLYKNLSSCQLCKKIANNITFSKITAGAISDQVTYVSDSEEWVIFKHQPGFIIMRMFKPTDSVKNVLQSLTLSVEKTSPKK